MSDHPEQWPILMRKDEVINLKLAVYCTGLDEKTIRGWCKQFGIGRQAKPGSPLGISAPALEMVVHGDMVALKLLRDGKRTDPRVSRYFDFLGLPSY
ncbi:hypothetical protein R1521_31050 [Rhizobium brockwellii]|uniref:Helix-turn-helix domain-containing protein n=1 Tax=Rhizobium brockwellii TaxID=3019932 RepID=A0ABU3YVI5_9HYPH|nr:MULTISPECIES: hypothetical protein [Rhizobium]MBY3447456.1 hypothetical protein [Rhizobium laguerreae]MDV4182955.1 hypothetical protein [Rhizobium brockwellii]MDV4189859.1 hypothetical protein [Rhizobium brockwellii]